MSFALSYKKSYNFFYKIILYKKLINAFVTAKTVCNIEYISAAGIPGIVEVMTLKLTQAATSYV